MKKITLALFVALLPLTAHAQSGGDQVTQAAAGELKPSFCANDLKQAIQTVEGCYAKVDEDSEKNNMNQCVIEDIVVIGAIKNKQKQYLNNYMSDPYANMDFIQTLNIGLRIMKHPNFFIDAHGSEESKEALRGAVKKVLGILQQDNCFDLDKLK